MDVKIWMKWIGKKVYLVLNSDRKYTGKIVNVDDAGNGLIFIYLVDRNGMMVTFSSGEIKLIQEEM